MTARSLEAQTPYLAGLLAVFTVTMLGVTRVSARPFTTSNPLYLVAV